MPEQPIDVLHADSNRGDRELVRQVLEQGGSPFRVTEAASRAELEARLAQTHYDLLLSDHRLQDLPSLHVLHLARAKRESLPAVILTGTGSEDLAVESMKRGAADYLTKDGIHRLPEVLLRIVTAARGRVPQEQHSTLRGLVDSLDANVFSVDRRYRYTSFNSAHAAAMRTFCNARIELGGRILDYVASAADQHLIQCALDGALAGEHVVREWHSGEQHPSQVSFVASFHPIQDDADQAVGVAVLVQDVTVRAHAERALRDSERRLAEAQRIAHIGYWERDLQAGHIMLSDEACRIFGLPPQAVPYDLEQWHQRWLELIHPADQPRVAKAAADAVAGGPAYNLEYRVVRPGGGVRFIHSEAEVKWGTDGRPRSMLGMMQDITDFRQLEEQLRQSQKLEAIGQLAGGVAHDFNNLLAAIMLELSLLKHSELPQEVQDGLMQIDRATERAADLTRQLLTFSRRQPMQRRALDLNDVVSSLAKMLARIIGEDLDLEITPHSDPLPIHADPGMLDQLLLNLAVNARDAMPTGGQLFIRTDPLVVDERMASHFPDAQAGRYARLQVRDTGCGIPSEILPRVYEPFFTTKADGQGTGLGLATVFGIVKQHQGWIRVDSVVDEGTSFQVFLPLSPAMPASRVEDETQEPARGAETVLVVEDEQRVRELTCTVLRRYGYEVLEAADGDSALELGPARLERVALLVSDLVMPGGMSGLDLAAQLRARVPGIKVLLMSGYSPDIADRQLELDAAESFLPKPFTLTQLLRAVRQSLDA